MRKRPLTIAILAAAVPLLGGVTYAAASSVSTHPSPEVVIPHQKTDDPANHDARDGRKGVTATTAARGADDPANHDVGDDHGNDAATPGTTVTTTEDRSGRDGGDHGGSTSGPSSNSGPGNTASGSDGGSGSGRHGGDG
jgi:hypothetical protein